MDLILFSFFYMFNYEFKYDKDAINNASEKCHINILEWFKNSDYEFKYDENAIHYAFENVLACLLFIILHYRSLSFSCIFF